MRFFYIPGGVYCSDELTPYPDCHTRHRIVREHNCRKEAAHSLLPRGHLHRYRHSARRQREPLVRAHTRCGRRKPTAHVGGRLVPHVEAPRPDTPHADDLSPRVVPTWDRRAATVNRPCRTDTVRNMHFKARATDCTPIVDG